MPDGDIIPPPSNMTVAHEHRARLFTADGTPLVRQAGFTAGGRYAVSPVPETPREVPHQTREGKERC